MSTDDWMQINSHIDKVAAAVTGVVTKYGPQAWETIKTIRRMESIGWIAQNMTVLCVGITALLYAWHCYNLCLKADRHTDEESRYAGTATVLSIGGVIVSVIAGVQLSSIWLWIGAFNPELAIFHNLVEKVMH